MARKQTKLIRSKHGKLYRRSYLVSDKFADRVFVTGAAHLGAAIGALSGARYYNDTYNKPRRTTATRHSPILAPAHHGVFGGLVGYYAAKENKHRLGRRTKFALGIAGHAAGLYTGHKAAGEYARGLGRDFGWIFHLGQQ